MLYEVITNLTNSSYICYSVESIIGVSTKYSIPNYKVNLREMVIKLVWGLQIKKKHLYLLVLTSSKLQICFLIVNYLPLGKKRCWRNIL